MTEDTALPFTLPAVSRKKATADVTGGLISSDGGLILLREAERRLGLSDVPVALIPASHWDGAADAAPLIPAECPHRCWRRSSVPILAPSGTLTEGPFDAETHNAIGFTE